MKNWYQNTLVTALLIAAPFAVMAISAWPADSSGTLIGDSTNLGALYEPSDAYWDSEEQLLYIVSDTGKVSTLSDDGSTTQTWNVPGSYDIEGITKTEAGSNIVYLAAERDFADSNKDKLIAFNLDTNTVVDTWDISSLFSGAENEGIEALTFIPNEYHAFDDQLYGGVFVGGRQSDGALLYMSVTDDAVTELDTVASAQSDIAGLYYEVDTQKLYALYDGANLLRITEEDGSNGEEFSVPGNDQEGIAVASNCDTGTASLFITEDAGPEVFRYDNHTITCIEEEETIPPENPGDTSDEDPEEDTPEETQTENSNTRAITSNGKRIFITVHDILVRQKQFRQKRFRHYRVKIFDWRNRPGKTVVIAGRRGTHKRIITARITPGNRILRLHKKRVQLHTRSTRIRVIKKPHGKIVVRFGEKRARFKVTPRHNLVRL